MVNRVSPTNWSSWYFCDDLIVCGKECRDELWQGVISVQFVPDKSLSKFRAPLPESIQPRVLEPA